MSYAEFLASKSQSGAMTGFDPGPLHPLQLDVIDRGIVLWSNPGESVFTPFMGVGSEVYSAVRAGRKGIGVELKAAYYHQAVLNVQSALQERGAEQAPLFMEAPCESGSTI